MRLEITIHQDNAAFDDEPATETARILRALANKYEAGNFDGRLNDHNGNAVGTFATRED